MVQMNPLQCLLRFNLVEKTSSKKISQDKKPKIRTYPFREGLSESEVEEQISNLKRLLTRLIRRKRISNLFTKIDLVDFSRIKSIDTFHIWMKILRTIDDSNPTVSLSLVDHGKKGFKDFKVQLEVSKKFLKFLLKSEDPFNYVINFFMKFQLFFVLLKILFF